MADPTELIAASEANAWAEKTKLSITSLDDDLLFQIQEIVIRRLNSAYDTSVTDTWTSATNTPKLVRTVIAMKYFAAVYARSYSEDNDVDNNYATRLDAQAEALLNNIIAGLIDIGIPPGGGSGVGSPVFYPNDNSSAQSPTSDDPSLGPASFSMGQVF